MITPLWRGARKAGLYLLGATALLSGLACGGADIQAPIHGTMEITTITSGPEPDADGYFFSIDQNTETPISINATTRREDVDPGDHTVELGGLAANCSIAGENPRTVSVATGETTRVAFELACHPSTGSLQVTATTTGPSSDPDGYSVTLDGSDRGGLGVSGSLTLEGLTGGIHIVALSGVAANCSVEGENPRSVSVTAGASVAAAFTIVCSQPEPGTGSIRIVAQTSGPEPDIDGYAFSLDEGTEQPLGGTATVTLTNVPPGVHRVRLSGIAANCSVQETNPRSVTVSSGGTADVNFAIACTATTGGVTIITVTTGSSPDPDGYTLSLDHGAEQSIGVNGTVTVSNIPAGTHSLLLAKFATNCRVEGDNPRQVKILVGGVATAAFTVRCPPPDLTHWTHMTSGTTSTLLNISGSSASNIFVVDGEGVIRHYDGVTWALQPAPAKAFQVWANSATDAFATGVTSEGVPVVLRYDGRQWSIFFTPSIPAELVNRVFGWADIWGIGTDVFAVGNWSPQDDMDPAPAYVLHYDGATWSTDMWQWSTNGGGRLSEIWGSSRDNVYIVGTEFDEELGIVLRKSGADLSKFFEDGIAHFNHISGSSSSNIIVTGITTDRVSSGHMPTAWYFDGTSWSDNFRGPTGPVWASSADNFYLVEGRTIYRRGTDAVYTDRTSPGFTDIWGSSATDVYVVGGNGTILHGAP
jgi:hypothetical protein